MFEQKTDQTQTPRRPECVFSSGIIFGGANGIGKSIEEWLIQQGTPFVVSIDRDPSFQRSELPHSETGTARLLADITSPEQLKTVLRGARPASLELAVFSAGILREAEPELTRSVNVEGTKNCFAAVSPLLKPGALALFISSDLITFPVSKDSDLPTAYVASKRAMAEFAQSVARDRPDLRVLILLPGPVRTGLFLEGKPNEVLAQIEDRVGILSPSEFAQIVFRDVIPQLASQPSGFAAKIYKKKHDRSEVEWLDIRKYLAPGI